MSISLAPVGVYQGLVICCLLAMLIAAQSRFCYDKDIKTCRNMAAPAASCSGGSPMAVPPVPSRTVEHSSPAPTAKFLAWLRNIGSALARPLFAVVLAIVAGSIVIFITAPGGDRFATV